MLFAVAKSQPNGSVARLNFGGYRLLIPFGVYAIIPLLTHGGCGVGVNTSGCGPEDRGFESHHSPQKKADSKLSRLF